MSKEKEVFEQDTVEAGMADETQYVPAYEIIETLKKNIIDAINYLNDSSETVIKLKSDYKEKMENIKNTQYMMIGSRNANLTMYNELCEKYNMEKTNFSEYEKNIIIADYKD